MSAATHPTYANVLFLRVPRFAGLTVVEQAAAKQRLEARARKAFAAVPAPERVVLDADDGLALVVFGEPGRALDVAHEVGRQAEGEALLAGLNYGPLALTSRGADARVVGDGLAAAAAAARFAPEGQLLVTQDFANALGATAPDRSVELVTAGDFTDTRVRQHTFYGHDAQRGVLARRRSRLRVAALVVLILLAGVIGRDLYQPLKLSRPAVVTLDVKPRGGEVFVDGVSVGKVPPLTQIEVAPGKRRIVIRSPGVAEYSMTREFKPGEKAAITHTFPRAPAGKGSGSDIWKSLKRPFGG